MQFTLKRLYQLNRKSVLWAIFFGLIFWLREYFMLIFLTFIIGYFVYPLCRYMMVRFGFTRIFSLLSIYCGILAVYATMGYTIIPRLIKELAAFHQNLPHIKQSLKQLRSTLLSRESEIVQFLESFLPEERIDELIERYYGQLQQRMPDLAGDVVAFGAILLLSIIFSFFILLDLVRLRQQLRGLAASRLHDFYEETAQPVVRFALVLGQAMRAQAVIACSNTVLTVIGLIIMGVPSVAMLSAVVFVCSFIPVIGVFISTTPIVLIALNSSGPGLALIAIVFVCVIHIVEAYVLNPLIYGRHLKLNPVLVLMILYVGHHGFGFWGMMLGVPITYYVLYDVLGVRKRNEEVRMEPIAETI